MIAKLKAKEKYLRRIFSSYVFQHNSQLTFWHEAPTANQFASFTELGPYYMTFEDKALYKGPFDPDGIPLLDYHGDVGTQYNPIAVAQYALGNYNLFKTIGEPVHFERFIVNAGWLLNSLKRNNQGTYLWPHHFDFEYFRLLKAPWYSGLAQGQGLSVLVRAFAETNESEYLSAAEKVMCTLNLTIPEGGVLHQDRHGDVWIEEYLVEPPTHILNGFMWALWGVYDYWLVSRDSQSRTLFETFCSTIKAHLGEYDAGFWSFYELTPQRVKSLASAFYHRLHVVQLRIMYLMTGDDTFLLYAKKWQDCMQNPLYRTMALIYKAGFKLAYY